MSEATAVAEPVEKTEPQAVPPVESQAPAKAEGTETPAAVQTETPSESSTTTETPSADTEGERLRQEALAAQIEAAKEEGREEERQGKAQAQRTERQKRNLQAFHQNFGQTAQQVRSTLSQILIQDTAGNIRNLTAQEINSLAIAPFEAHNGFVLGTREEDLNTPTAEAAEALLSKEAYAKFTEKASGKPVKDFLAEFAEHKALETKAVRNLTPEDAEAASPKVKAAFAKLRSDLHEAETKAKELQDKYGPEGDPLRNGNTRVSSSRSDDVLLADPETPINKIIEIRARQRASGQ